MRFIDFAVTTSLVLITAYLVAIGLTYFIA